MLPLCADPVASVDLSDESEDDKTTAEKPTSSSAAATPAPHELATNTDELDRYRTTKKVSATRAFEPGICLAFHDFDCLLLQYVDEALAAQPPGTRHELVLELKMQPAVFDAWYQCAAGDEQLWQTTTSHVRTQVNIILMRMKRQEEEKNKAQAEKAAKMVDCPFGCGTKMMHPQEIIPHIREVCGYANIRQTVCQYTANRMR